MRLAWLWIFGAAAAGMAAADEPRSHHTNNEHDPAAGRICETLSREQARIKFQHRSWDLREIDDLEELVAALDREIATSSGGAEDKPSDPHAGDDRDALAGMKSRALLAMQSHGSSCDALVEVAEISDSLDLGT